MISRTHISTQKPHGRMLNAKVCGSESAIFLILLQTTKFNNDISKTVQVLPVILSQNWCLSDQREVRLEQMSIAQQRRLTHESPEETATRCEEDRESHRGRREQQSVRTKIVNFHSHLAALQVSKCVTCLEKFPGLNVRTMSPDSTQCS